MAKPVQNITNHGKMQRPRVLIVDDNGAQLNMFAQRVKNGEFLGVEPVFVPFGPQPQPFICEDHVLQPMGIGEIAAYVLDPANRIDAVVTDLYESLGELPSLVEGERAELRDPDDEDVPLGEVPLFEEALFEEYPELLKEFDITEELRRKELEQQDIYRNRAEFGRGLVSFLKGCGFEGAMAIYTTDTSTDPRLQQKREKAKKAGALDLFDARDFKSKSPKLSAFAAVIEAVQRGREPDRLAG
jgi:hypothetical protein